ncbi:nucleoid occlusion protein [Clostridium algidicarnis]|uniref:ParB family protein n=2 Tax=Clostridium algidicarnis TaxID=37659 RepID=A0A2S6FW92_9CLOT|nr:nucleoid occlusion protein [Clostridium algidicarnis]MBB6697071.1 nucleoid occlusion protein [Clostridium algidicarnis]MBU3194759.1 nucleoid occlusion protein [Clostridium algidicarnis]MBU3197308.1 nucleoid occlusion protein [Clostridium algidicarnis]MBU3204776.1 nucleoid occlusion protein [Clostridium algidicarnis]MBU3212739.1 nucleoid occlusion protein [Clostridium algidicarnis]
MHNEITYIEPNLILPNLYQPRKYFDEDAITELAESIESYGIIQPLSVRKMREGRYELVAGERRLRAAKKLGLPKVPVIIVDISDRDSAAIALLENLQREDLNYMEESEAYFNLIKEHGYTQEQLASVIGKKQSTIANKLRLLKLSQNVREIVLDNKLTERHARALLKLPTEKLQQKILNIVIKKSLNVKDTEELINRELIKISSDTVSKDGKKRIKGIFSPKVYINTIKQVFDKYGISAKYDSKDFDEFIEVTIKIPKK